MTNYFRPNIGKQVISKKIRHFLNIEEVVKRLRPSYPVYCLRLDELRIAARQFLDHFPGKILYAVKCNPHPLVLRALFEAGIQDFDTASLAEILTVVEIDKHARAYFMHPIKSRNEIVDSYSVYGLSHYVVDHSAELNKIKQELKNAKRLAVLVRFATPGGVARFELSQKFGATIDDAVRILREVEEAGFDPGLTFHVGSQCHSPDAYLSAVRLSGEIAERAGVELQYLDVGGGFPSNYLNASPPPLSDFFKAIEQGIGEIVLSKDCIVMCEPGRALVAEACSLVVKVQLRKGNALYINDGIYHSMAECVSSGLKPTVRLIRPGERFTEESLEFTVYGPTCDNTDCLPYRLPMPADTREGDWLEFGQMGAYSNSMASNFNGFCPSTFVTLDK